MEEVAEESPTVSTAPKPKGGGRFTNKRTLGYTLRLIVVQFGLLLWKNALLQIRRPLGTFFEIITPLTTVSVLLILRFTVFNFDYNCFVTYNSDPLVIPRTDSYILYYAPNTTEVNDLAANYIAPLLLTSGGSLEGVETSDGIQAAVEDSNVTRSRGCFLGGAGVYFESISNDDIKFSIRLRYETNRVNWLIDLVAAPLELAGPRHVPYQYLDEGFMQLQKIISEAIIHYRTGQPVAVNVESRQIPSPVYGRDFFVFSLDFLLPLLVSISFVYSVGVFVKELVLEKESRTKEMMKIMGLSNWILTATWFIKEFIFLFFTAVIYAIMLKYGIILPNSNLLLLIIFFFLFVTSTIAFCFFLSSLFSSATLGLLAGILTWSTLSIIHFFISQSYDDIHFSIKLLLSLLSSNLCTGFGIQVLSKLEQSGLGLNYQYFFTPVSFTDTTFSMAWTFLILFLNTITYMILYWYIEAVFPGQYGIAKKPYFFLQPSYWRRTNKKHKLAPSCKEEEVELEERNEQDSNHEPDPAGLSVGISINNLGKVFNSKKSDSEVVAVNKMSLKMYEGQITALLGHNGAGKTTTINILSGFYPPTSGNAFINGLSVLDDIELIRTNLGLCPQHNVLFDRLTVREHLRFFIKLKGVSGNTTDAIDDLLDDLELIDKSDVQSQNLSGGMKRKLSVAISLIGGSKFVILDEPTSGMDPYARRITWDLLIKHKEGRTILLTTQFMDEADILGDRIAIMKSGRVKTSGSSLFLKKRYGCGYHLTIEKASISTDSEEIIAVVQDMVGGSRFLYDIGTEVVLLLPDEKSILFSSLINTLENRKRSLGISSYGVSVTTMEEVFIQVGKDEDEEIQKKIQRKRTEYFEKQTSDVSEIIETIDSEQSAAADEKSPVPTKNFKDFNAGNTLIFQQFYAMLVKHFYYFTRFWMGIILAVVLPIFFVLLTLLIIKFDTTDSTGVTELTLTFPDLAEESSNITLFWAKFGNNFPIQFGADNATAIQATDFLDFTSDIESIRSSVANISSASDCCSYKYQILDKYCATRTPEELSECTNSDFGYSLCMNCLSCCTARGFKIPSCSDPSAESLYPNDAVFCPAPPVLSLADRTMTDPAGPLDDVNTYTAEKILQYIEKINIGLFETLFQGGFVLHNTPVSGYAVCGCSNTSQTCSYLTPALLSSLNDVPTSVTFNSIDSFVNDFCSAFTDSDPDCHLLTSPSDWNQDYSGTLAACIDQASCDLSQYQCQCVDSQCQFGRTSPVVSSVPTATVWYNHKAYHTAPVVLNSFYNLYLKSFNSNLSITVTNHPFTSSLTTELSSLSRVSFETHGITIAVTIGLGFSFLYASLTILLTKEREERVRDYTTLQCSLSLAAFT
ncbi:PREDICTED: ATP-binding cassette sub-family A member 3-like, partial [Amphimedon queenslandica]